MTKRQITRDLSVAWREGHQQPGDVPTGTHRGLLLLLILFASALIATRCELIDDLFNDDEEKQENTSDTGMLKVGTEGGQVSLNQLHIYIAAGTFDKEQDILITAMEGDDDFGENAGSAVYQISGLSEVIHKPIRIAINYDGILTGDPLIAIGEEMYATSLDSVLTAYHTQAATDSAGYLVYHIPANTSQVKSPQESDIATSTLIKLVALNKFKVSLSSNNHFILSYPIANQQEGIVLGQHFEKAYETCLTMGFSSEGKDWPVSVIAKKLAKKNVAGYYSWSIPGGSGTTDSQIQASVKTGKFTINTILFTDDEELAVTAGHEFLHLVQHLYEFSSPWVEPEQSWLKEASAVWFEEKFTDKPYYMSSSHKNREKYMFDGWQYKDRGYAKNGYGLSPIIKGVAERYGDDAIVKMFEIIKEGVLPTDAVDPVDAVFSVITEPVVHFWHSVLGAYLLGYYYNAYGNMKSDKTCAMDAKGVVIEPEIHKDYILNYSAHDLSGQIFILTAGNLTAQSTVPLSFSVNDPAYCGILVGKYRQDIGLLPIGEFFPGEGDRVFIEDAKTLFDEGYDLMVMVSNGHHDQEANYQGMSDIELKIEIAEPPVARFEKVSLSYGLDLKWDNVCSSGNSSPPGPGYTFQSHGVNQEPLDVYLFQSGNTFSGTWTGHTTYLPGTIYTGSIKFTLRDDENAPVDQGEGNIATLVEFEFLFEQELPEGAGNDVPQIFGWKIRMADATYLLRPNGDVEIFIRGKQTCEQLFYEYRQNCYEYDSNEFRYMSCAPQCSRDHAGCTISLRKASHQ